jgi:hypothetical protein
MQEMVPYKRLLGMDIAQMSLGAHHKATGLDKIKRNRSCALEKQAQGDIFAATEEITESLLIHDVEKTLRQFPLDAIKIDRSFIRDVTAASAADANPEKRNLADAIIALPTEQVTQLLQSQMELSAVVSF